MAIARGLVNRPPVILADEPTAPLDSERALAVVRILNAMAQQYQTAIIVVTHDEKSSPPSSASTTFVTGKPDEKPARGAAFRTCSMIFE